MSLTAALAYGYANPEKDFVKHRPRYLKFLKFSVEFPSINNLFSLDLKNISTFVLAKFILKYSLMQNS